MHLPPSPGPHGGCVGPGEAWLGCRGCTLRASTCRLVPHPGLLYGCLTAITVDSPLVAGLLQLTAERARLPYGAVQLPLVVLAERLGAGPLRKCTKVTVRLWVTS